MVGFGFLEDVRRLKEYVCERHIQDGDWRNGLDMDDLETVLAMCNLALGGKPYPECKYTLALSSLESAAMQHYHSSDDAPPCYLTDFLNEEDIQVIREALQITIGRRARL